VYADTAEDVSYGAGYALATDRLWQMHVFRRIAKGQLSTLLGIVDILGVANTVDIDKDVRFFTYTAEERARRLETYPESLRANLQAFADGVNARIGEVQLNPTLLPLEFVEFADPIIDPWTVDDSQALGDVLILAFGSGGGGEVDQAALLADLVKKFGEEDGLVKFNDLVLTEDPDGPITIPADYEYTTEPTGGRDAESESRRALTADARLSLPPAASPSPSPTATTASAPRPASAGTLAQLKLIPDVARAVEGFRAFERAQKALEYIFSFGSNAQIVGPQHSESGNAVQTAGPQVGYLLPQWLADIGLHAEDGSFDAMGMTFAGVGPAVLIGRGKGYAWTTTTGSSDLTDTFVEKLNPKNARQYEFNGVFEDMECRTEEYSFRGLIPIETQEICRTRHGPVVAFDEPNGVAYSLRYAWFDREGQTVEGFFAYNNVRSLEDFATAANFLASNHNMFYTDDQGHYGYWHPGNHVVRAPGVDLRLPQDGRGGSEWAGLVPVQQVPHAVDFPRGWLSNWNNQPALGWKRERSWNAIDNAADLARTLNPLLPAVADPLGDEPVNADRKLNFEDLSGNLRYAAFKDHLDIYFRALLPEDTALTSDAAKEAAGVVREWDGFRTDRNDDGLLDSAGTTILRGWVSTMRAMAFDDDLGALADTASESLLWHVLTTGDTLSQGVDWLNGVAPAAFAAEAFEEAVKALAAERGGAPESWQDETPLEHYQRLNADLIADTVEPVVGIDNSQEHPLPGDVADQIKMDRGTYNHVVVYTSPPSGTGVLGESGVEHGSVIPPGQSGFISLVLLQEDAHYQDQAPLYLEWKYKPMWMTLEEALADAESEITISR
jgi:penicillin amidase